jgi:hypothetical protein
MYGYTGNYIRVKYPYQADLINLPVTITLHEMDEEGVYLCSINETISML